MYPSMKPGNVVLGLLASSLWLGFTTAAHADMMDARSLSMGGAKAANAMGTAFGPLYNPAAIGGNWSMILPGVSLGLGNNIVGFGQITQLTNLTKDPSNLLTNIGGLVGTLGTQTSRIEATVGVPIVGFNGHPFPLKLQGAPVDFGLNLYVNGGANVTLGGTQGMLGLFTNSAAIMNNVSTLQQAVTTGPQQLQSAVAQAQQAFAGLQNINDPTAIAGALNSSVTALETLNTQLNAVLNPVQSAASSVTSALGPFGTDAQRLALTAAADGHLTLAATAKATVLQTNVKGLPITLSLGTNLKGFIMPQVASMPSVVGQLTGDTTATDKVPPVAAQISVNTQPLSSIAGVTKTVSDANSVITTAQQTFTSVLNSVKQAQTAANSGDPTAAFAALPGAISAGQQAAQSLPQITSLVSNLSGIQSTLTNDLKNIKLQATSFSEVSPVGFGADIGATAQIGDEVTVGASLDNLFVLWPGKQRVSNLMLNLNGGSPFVADPSAPATTQNANYDLTEPRALRLGGTYRPTRVPSLTVAADVEQVFNGRPFAAHIGGEYRVANVLGLRLGGQLGGFGTMVTGGIGVKAGAFNADLGAGIGGQTAQGALNFSLAF